MMLLKEKNKSLQKITQTTLNANFPPKRFWVEVINITCYLQNKIYIRSLTKKILYKIVEEQKV